MNYLILNVETSRRMDEMLWWCPNNAGYTTDLDAAGRYSEAEVRASPDYYNNRETTLAVPESIAIEHAHRVVRCSRPLLAKMRRASLKSPRRAAPTQEVPHE